MRTPRLVGIALVSLVLVQLPVLAASGVSARDDAFLEDLERRSFQFFWEQSDPGTGLTLDRAGTDGRSPERAWPVREVAVRLRDYIARLSRIWIEGQVMQVSRRSGSLVYVTLRDVSADQVNT